MTAAHLISSALFCAVVGALIHGERGWRADLFIVGPLLLFEMACAKMGFDRSGVRGAIDGAGFGSIAAGWPALLLAITLFGKRSRAAAITMIVVYIQWFGVFALFGQWREAALAALGVGMTWLATRLLRPEVDRWMHNHLPGPTAVVATVAAYPALLTLFLERAWTPMPRCCPWLVSPIRMRSSCPCSR